MSFLDSLVRGGIWFSRHLVGVVVAPYSTLREIADQKNVWELPYLALLLSFYFIVVSWVKVSAFRPFLLTQQFVLLTSTVGLTFLLAVGVLWMLGKWVKATGDARSLFMTWGYTLVPTFCWFFGVSVLSVLFPPPRTTNPLGILLSIVVLVFSCALFFWKLTLGYLALRFSLRLDLGKILIIAGIFLPLLFVYSICMYQLGIFRVPFV